MLQEREEKQTQQAIYRWLKSPHWKQILTVLSPECKYVQLNQSLKYYQYIHDLFQKCEAIFNKKNKRKIVHILIMTGRVGMRILNILSFYFSLLLFGSNFYSLDLCTHQCQCKQWGFFLREFVSTFLNVFVGTTLKKTESTSSWNWDKFWLWFEWDSVPNSWNKVLDILRKKRGPRCNWSSYQEEKSWRNR